MALSPQKEASSKRAPAPLPRVRNRQPTETPVVIRDGSGSDTAVSVQPAQAVKPVATVPTVPTVATVAPRESAPVPSERGPVPELDKVDTVPSSRLYRSTGPPTEVTTPEDAASAWTAFVAEGIKSVEEAGRTAPTPSMPAAVELVQGTEPEDAVGMPDSRRAPMVDSLSLDCPAFPRCTGSFSFSYKAALDRRDAVLVKEYTETNATWDESVRSRFLQNHWIAYQVPSALPCYRTMVFDALDGLYLEVEQEPL